MNIRKASTAVFGSQAVEDLLLEGLNIRQAAAVFHIHNVEMGNLIRKANIQPIGTRNGVNVYSIPDLASVCVSPVWTDKQWEDVMHKGHFPEKLKKDFWASRTYRLKYLREAGEYWHTSEVINAVSEMNKTFAMGVKLIPDALERLTTLTPEQKSTVTELLDDVMRGIYKTVQETFGENLEKERLERYCELTEESVNEHELAEL